MVILLIPSFLSHPVPSSPQRARGRPLQGFNQKVGKDLQLERLRHPVTDYRASQVRARNYKVQKMLDINNSRKFIFLLKQLHDYGWNPLLTRPHELYDLYILALISIEQNAPNAVIPALKVRGCERYCKGLTVNMAMKSGSPGGCNLDWIPSGISLPLVRVQVSLRGPQSRARNS